LGLIPRGLPRFLEESLKTDGFHPIKNYLPLNASWACPEDYLLIFYHFLFPKVIRIYFEGIKIRFGELL
jgi:hypothetical protein